MKSRDVRNIYFDREGRPITADEWRQKFEDYTEKRVLRTKVKHLQVSTVWLGLDHNFGHGRPLIFETMVFENEVSEHKEMDLGKFGKTPKFNYHKALDDYSRRYSTLEEATAGHLKVVNEVKRDLRKA